MATRQSDVLGEYLCLYRVLESADGRNGKDFAEHELAGALTREYGHLGVRDTVNDLWVNAFEVYRSRAREEIARLRTDHAFTDADIASHLYAIRNSLAHGKQDIRTFDLDVHMREVAGALPIAKLLARTAVEP